MDPLFHIGAPTPSNTYEAMGTEYVDLELGGGVALVTFGRAQSANALNPPLLAELFQALQEAQQRPGVQAIVLYGSNGRFCNGYDINEFSRPGNTALDPEEMATLHRALRTLCEAGAKPTVAAIEAAALGGGLELAMACNARVCTPGAVLGLPELRLGIIPGMGGTQRLPRLVGLQWALDLMLNSSMLQAEEAVQLGLVEQEVPPGELLAAARGLALDLAEGRRPRTMALDMSNKLGSAEEAAAVLGAAREQAAGQERHTQLCVEAVQCGVERGGSAGLLKEAECFRAAASLDHHKAQLHLYHMARALKKLQRGQLAAAPAALRHFLAYYILQLRGALKKRLGLE